MHKHCIIFGHPKSTDIVRWVLFLYPKTERMMNMWCENLSNGKVRYVERYVNPITEKEGKVSVTMNKDTVANRKSAQITLHARIEEKMKDLFVPTKKSDLTLSELAILYLDEQKRTLKQSTYTRNYFAINKIVGYLGGNSLVNNLSALYVKNHLYVGTQKPGTQNERLKRFKAFIRWGYESELVQDISWLDKLKPFEDKDKKKKLEDKYLESDELKLVLNNMTIDHWRFLTELTALSGMRCGEALALETSDIDFERRIITISKTYDTVNKIVTTPKTEDSFREIFMQDQLFELCKHIKKYMACERMRTGCRTKLLLSDTDGDHLQYAAYNKYLKTITQKTVGKTVTTHFMRHTHVALLSEKGIPLDVIARRLGHSDSKTTKDIYFHVTEKLKQKDWDMVRSVNII